MKTQFEDAARDVQSSVDKEVKGFESDWQSATAGLGHDSGSSSYEPLAPPLLSHRPPKKNWRLKRGAMPQWYKHRHGVRSKAQSGAARVARFRPPRSL
jgi:sec-independent protein translocase protein TatB